MITKEKAFAIIKKAEPGNVITLAYEFPDKFAFLTVPKGANADTLIKVGTYVMKKDGSIKYGIPTVQEMEHAVKLSVTKSDRAKEWIQNKA